MALGIIIINWNQADDTIACIQAINRWSAPPRIVWVVDNASTGNDAQQIAQACPDARLIVSETNRGFAGGNNFALKEALAAGCETLLLLNNDAYIEAADLLHLQKTLYANPQLGMVGPVMWDGLRPDVLLSAGGRDIGCHLATHIKELPAADELREVAYATGTCILIRADTLRTIGLLDEHYFFGGEVADLCARARQHGYASAIDGGARATHRIERSSDLRHWLHIYYVLRNRFLFVQKFHKPQRRRLFIFWTVQSVRAGLHALTKRDWQRARAIALACVDGWRGRFGAQNSRITRGKIT